MSSFMQQFKETKTIAKRSKKYLEDALYHYLFREGSSELCVRQKLNEFLKSRKRVYKWEVDHCLKILRSRNRFYPALKLSEAMEHRGMNKTVGDQAVHLDLLAKARGLAAAETYFMDLPEPSKTIMTYGALFNCYCKELKTEKAEALLEKMKELKLEITAMSYNSLMTLYSKTSQTEKIPSVIQEMKASNIKPDTFTYNIWMRALASVNDISGVERVVEELNKDDRVAADWTTYSNLASIYVNAGLFKKAEEALKELEAKNDRQSIHAYQYLITLYGRTGNLLEVYRVWRSLKLAFRKTANISYLNMIQVLVKLNDLPGAEKHFREWEFLCPTYDIRVSNVLIEAYLKDGLVDKAEEIKERARRRGTEPNAKTHEIFLEYYLKKGEMKSAVECVDKAISAGTGDGSGKWVPLPDVTDTLMRHFEQKKDVDGAEAYLAILEKAVDRFGPKVFESLIRTYAAAGRTSPMIRRRMKMENTEVGEGCKELLDVVSVVD